MTPQKAGAGSSKPIRSQGGRLKDEVYRQMFRLEECRPGAEMRLALALVRAWLAADSKPENAEERDWLKKVTPICLQMIETALKANAIVLPFAQ